MRLFLEWTRAFGFGHTGWNIIKLKNTKNGIVLKKTKQTQTNVSRDDRWPQKRKQILVFSSSIQLQKKIIGFC